MIDIREEPSTLAILGKYGQVPSRLRVESRFNVEAVHNGLGGWILPEVAVNHPWNKDYDTGLEGPSGWAKRFNTAKWGILAAFDGSERVGGAVLAWDTPSVHMLEGRTDLAVLWDIRVRPEYRRSGVGQLLFSAAIPWAKNRRCRLLKIETQNINVPACKFYARMGCELRAIHPGAYPELPDEVQFLWYRRL